MRGRGRRAGADSPLIHQQGRHSDIQASRWCFEVHGRGMSGRTRIKVPCSLLKSRSLGAFFCEQPVRSGSTRWRPFGC
jgi:hypothetical protein